PRVSPRREAYTPKHLAERILDEARREGERKHPLLRSRVRRYAMKTVVGVCSALAVVLTAHSPGVLAHWPDQPPHQIEHLGDLQLESGGVLTNFKMSYVTHGRLNAAKDNAILFMHGFGLNHHQVDHLIGSGRPLDTDKYFIICSDALGNTQTTFEHSTSPTNSGLKMAFPAYNLRDRGKAEPH